MGGQKQGSYGSGSVNICTDLDQNLTPDPDLSINKQKNLEENFCGDLLSLKTDVNVPIPKEKTKQKKSFLLASC
jgi:hypothetical protein